MAWKKSISASMECVVSVLIKRTRRPVVSSFVDSTPNAKSPVSVICSTRCLLFFFFLRVLAMSRSCL